MRKEAGTLVNLDVPEELAGFQRPECPTLPPDVSQNPSQPAHRTLGWQVQRGWRAKDNE